MFFCLIVFNLNPPTSHSNQCDQNELWNSDVVQHFWHFQTPVNWPPWNRVTYGLISLSIFFLSGSLGQVSQSNANFHFNIFLSLKGSAKGKTYHICWCLGKILEKWKQGPKKLPVTKTNGKIHTNATNVISYPLRQVIWRDIWKHRAENVK